MKILVKIVKEGKCIYEGYLIKVFESIENNHMYGVVIDINNGDIQLAEFDDIKVICKEYRIIFE